MSLRTATIAVTILAAAAPVPAQQQTDPFRFFEGRTESQGTVKVIFRRPYRTASIGQGRIEKDGSLTLVQRVTDQGKAAHLRSWHIRQTGVNEYAGTMSEATGPVTIDKTGDRYRFRFAMKGDLSVEELLTPLPGDRSASTLTKVRRFGLTVATVEGTIRKV